MAFNPYDPLDTFDPSIDTNAICCTCGERYGLHAGMYCNDRDSYSESRVFITITSGVAAPGPRKPQPALPVEVHNHAQFDPDAAWAAIVALSKGS